MCPCGAKPADDCLCEDFECLQNENVVSFPYPIGLEREGWDTPPEAA